MIVLLESLHPDAVEVLRAVDDVVLSPSPTALPSGHAADVVAIVTRGLGRIDAEMISGCPSLRVVARCGAGVDNIDVVAAAEAGAVVVHAPGITAGAVAEHAMMLTLCLARQTIRTASAAERGDWSVRDGFSAVELRGRRMGVIGLGNVGRRVAELGLAFGMDVVGWSRRPVDSSVPQVALGELIASSDVIQLCVAAAATTKGMIGDAVLADVRRGALLVNTARGSLIDPEAVGEALDDGRLGGYATDVWEPEPPPAGDCLLAHPRVIVTPHVAAFTDITYRTLCVAPATAVAAIVRGDVADPRFVLSG